MTRQLTLPTFRLPCLHQETLQHLSLTHFQGRPVVLTCLSTIMESDAWLLESQASECLPFHGTLILLFRQSFPCASDWTRRLESFAPPMFIDPLRRLQHRFHLSQVQSPYRCETLIFSPDGFLALRMFHTLSLRGFSTVIKTTEMLYTHYASVGAPDQSPHRASLQADLEASPGAPHHGQREPALGVSEVSA